MWSKRSSDKCPKTNKEAGAAFRSLITNFPTGLKDLASVLGDESCDYVPIATGPSSEFSIKDALYDKMLERAVLTPAGRQRFVLPGVEDSPRFPEMLLMGYYSLLPPGGAPLNPLEAPSPASTPLPDPPLPPSSGTRPPFSVPPTPSSPLPSPSIDFQQQIQSLQEEVKRLKVENENLKNQCNRQNPSEPRKEFSEVGRKRKVARYGEIIDFLKFKKVFYFLFFIFYLLFFIYYFLFFIFYFLFFIFYFLFFIFYFLFFIFYLLFIIYYLLFIIYYLLFIIYYLLFIIYYLLFIIYYLLFIIYYLLFIIYFLFFIIYYLLFIIYYLFFIIYYLLFIIYYLLCYGFSQIPFFFLDLYGRPICISSKKSKEIGWDCVAEGAGKN